MRYSGCDCTNQPNSLRLVRQVLDLYSTEPSGLVLKEEYIAQYLRIVRLLMPRMSAMEAAEEAEVR